MIRFLIGLIAGLISGILLFSSLLERGDAELMD